MKGLSLWKPDFLLLLLAFSIFSIFHLSKKKDILKNNIFYVLSPGLPDRKKLCLLSEHARLEKSIILGACIPCTRIQLPLVLCTRNLPLAPPGIFGRTIPDLLGFDLMTTMVTLGIFLRGGLWKCYSWLFLFFSVGVPILWISILCFFLSLRCTGRALCFSLFFSFFVIERCFLDYSLHQF